MSTELNGNLKLVQLHLKSVFSEQTGISFHFTKCTKRFTQFIFVTLYSPLVFPDFFWHCCERFFPRFFC